MFDITPDDIALLNDGDLRALVGQLCEAELRSRGLSASFVMWGGDQNAADDGIDVHVDLPAGTQIDGFVAMPATGFQVKKMDMEPAEIRKEMRPHGMIRPVIQALANQGGAYIIVTSSSATYRKLQSRNGAMKAAVADVENAEALKIDYYDRTRIASWVRSHPSVILWVRGKIGKSISGWRPFGAWASPMETAEAEYLLDDQLRVETGKEEDGNGLNALAGIEHIRRILRSPGTVVRLVGLSGVGKTRFAQALFDSRIGQFSLDKNLAIYTNISESPDPQPLTLATDLATMGARAILVIDNCTPELHRSLSSVCRTTGSKLSVITIEYDVREDLPEGTDVFTLEPSSPDLIKKLIALRFPKLLQITVETIAENSDGNARVALALAGTVGVNETISSLADEDLFRRLFQQGHVQDESLLLAAQALSLVYSFHGENVSADDDAELVRLGQIVGKNAAEMYSHTATLHDRNLVQQRDVWRAVLPHALANRLAKGALKRIPPGTIRTHLVNGAPERLLKSFSRRLSYLSDSAEAVAIAKAWLAPDGMLTNVAKLGDFGTSLFENVAPVAPDAALAALERTLLGPTGDEAVANCDHFVRIIRLLAFDAGMFERCTTLLLKFSALEEVNNNIHEGARNIFISLFSLFFSGTHATLEQRLTVLEPLLKDNDPKQQNLGLKALAAMLEAMHMGSAYSFDFGSRARDYGYWPKTADDLKLWFVRVLQFATELACSDGVCALAVQELIAEKFRGLWAIESLQDELEKTCDAIMSKKYWQQGWIAIRETQGYDGKGMPPTVAARLSSLEERIRPKDLLQSIRAIALGDGSYSYDLVPTGMDDNDESGDAMSKRIVLIDERVRQLGKAAAEDQGVFDEVIAELLTGKGLLWMFGEGLAQGSRDLREKWDHLKSNAAKTPREALNLQLLRGFLNRARRIDDMLTNQLLVEAVEDETLGYWYPALEAASDIDEAGVTRLMRSLSVGKAPVGSYNAMIYGGVMKTIQPDTFEKLAKVVASKKDGFNVAIELLYMRVHLEKREGVKIPPEFQEVGWHVLESVCFSARDQRQDHRLAEIAKACLPGKNCAARVAELCKRLKQAVLSHQTSIVYYDDLLVELLRAEPRAALDALCQGDGGEAVKGLDIIGNALRVKNRLFDVIPQGVLLDWCDGDSVVRYPAMAGRITISTNEDAAGERDWTPLALRLLEKAPNPIEVLKRYTRQIRLSGGWGSPASITEANARLLDKLPPSSDSAMKAFIEDEKVRLAQDIEELRRHETARDRKRSERFE